MKHEKPSNFIDLEIRIRLAIEQYTSFMIVKPFLPTYEGNSSLLYFWYIFDENAQDRPRTIYINWQVRVYGCLTNSTRIDDGHLFCHPN